MSAAITVEPSVVTANTITLLQFAPFTYKFTSLSPMTFSESSPEAAALCTSSDEGRVVTFASTTGYAISFSNPLLLVLRTAAGSRVSYNVSVLAGRWTIVPSPPFTFFRGEAVGGDYDFTTTLAIDTVFVQPSLPAGLRLAKVTPNVWRLQGTPFLQSPTTSYLVVGRSANGKLISTSVAITVSAERIILLGGPTSATLQVDAPLPVATFTTRVPTTNSSLFRYTASDFLPKGLFYTDVSDVPVTLPFSPPDAARTLKIKGSPTLEAALEFQSRTALFDRTFLCNVNLNAQAGTLSATEPLQFSFGPTVLFTQVSNFPSLFTNIPISRPISYKAARYFQDPDVPITAISANVLPAGLTLRFLSSSEGAVLEGTPSVAGSDSYTITAVDASGNSAEVSVPMTVVPASIILQPLQTDTSFSFIQSRSLNEPRQGFYPAAVSFSALSSAGCNVTFSLAGLEDTGIVLSNVTSNIVSLAGTPTTVKGLGPVTITATDGFATNSQVIEAGVLADVFTFTSVPLLTLIQNRAMVPTKVTATTLSERVVTNYFCPTSLPAGLSINASGVLEGTPLVAGSGIFPIVATTGFATATILISYTIARDDVLVVAPIVSRRLEPGEATEPIQISALTYSGRAITEYTIVGGESYGLEVHPVSGVLSGNASLGYPPDPLYARTSSFRVQATAGDASGSLQVRVDTENPFSRLAFVPYQSNNLQLTTNLTSSTANCSLLTTSSTFSSWQSFYPPFENSALLAATYFYTTPQDHLTRVLDRRVTSAQVSPLTTTVPASVNDFNSYFSNASYIVYPFVAKYGGYSLDTMAITAGENIYSWPPVVDWIRGFDAYGYSSAEIETFLSNLPMQGVGDAYYPTEGQPPLFTEFLTYVIFNYGQLSIAKIVEGSLTSDDFRKAIETTFAAEWRYFLAYPAALVDFTPKVGRIEHWGWTQFYDYTLGPSFVEAPVRAPPLLAHAVDEDGTHWGVTGDVLTMASVPTNASSAATTLAYSTKFRGSLVKSLDAGATWTTVGDTPFYPRTRGDNRSTPEINPAMLWKHPYKERTASLTVKNSVMLLGGQATEDTPALLRSADGGTAWRTVTNGFAQEVAYVDTSVEGLWVATGSDANLTSISSTSDSEGTSTVTIKTSSDMGESWSDAYAFDRMGYHIARGNGMWLASGVSATGPELRYSTTGSVWTKIDLSSGTLHATAPFYTSLTNERSVPMLIGPIHFTDSTWKVFVTRRWREDENSSSLLYWPEVYTHDTSSSITQNWQCIDLSGQFGTSTMPDAFSFLTLTPTNVVGTGTPANIPTCTFLSVTANGPTFTAPTSSLISLYQYIRMTPLTFVAQGSGPVYYFLRDSEVPDGYTFDPVTGTLSGVPTAIGNFRLTVFAKDSVGTSQLTVTLNVQIPRLQKVQSSAGAFTSLTRHYTQVNAAQNARDSKVLNREEYTLGAFMAPSPPDVVSDVPCPVCPPA